MYKLPARERPKQQPSSASCMMQRMQFMCPKTGIHFAPKARCIESNLVQSDHIDANFNPTNGPISTSNEWQKNRFGAEVPPMKCLFQYDEMGFNIAEGWVGSSITHPQKGDMGLAGRAMGMLSNMIYAPRPKMHRHFFKRRKHRVVAYFTIKIRTQLKAARGRLSCSTQFYRDFPIEMQFKNSKYANSMCLRSRYYNIKFNFKITCEQFGV